MSLLLQFFPTQQGLLLGNVPLYHTYCM